MKNSPSQIWKTIVVLVLASVIAFVIWRLEWILYIGLGIGISALLSPRWAKWIHQGWMKLAEGLGWINSRILLGIIFYLLLTPIALMVRLFRKDPLQLRRPETDSLWHDRDHLFTAKDLKNPW
ncbi:MAG: SxtJ family membrane protein [Bacteroidota bacterium]